MNMQRSPLIAKPNAGLPEWDGDKTVYKTTPEEFAQDGKLLIEAGAHIVGGCCGTTPDISGPSTMRSAR